MYEELMEVICICHRGNFLEIFSYITNSLQLFKSLSNSFWSECSLDQGKEKRWWIWKVTTINSHRIAGGRKKEKRRDEQCCDLYGWKRKTKCFIEGLYVEFDALTMESTSERKSERNNRLIEFSIEEETIVSIVDKNNAIKEKKTRFGLFELLSNVAMFNNIIFFS